MTKKMHYDTVSKAGIRMYIKFSPIVVARQGDM